MESDEAGSVVGEEHLATTLDEALALWERLGRSGLVVSICYGPSGEHGCAWSVQALKLDTSVDFCKASYEAYEARGFMHAVKTAYLDARKRGWIDW